MPKRIQVANLPAKMNKSELSAIVDQVAPHKVLRLEPGRATIAIRDESISQIPNINDKLKQAFGRAGHAAVAISEISDQ